MEIEKILKDLGKEIDELINKARNATGEIREELGDTIEELKKQRDNLEEKIADLRTRSEPKLDEAKVHLKTAMEEIGKAFDKMFRKGPGAKIVDED